MSEVLSEGLRSSPVETQWVCRASNRGTEALVRELLPSPEVVALHPTWKYEYTPKVWDATSGSYEVAGKTRKVDDRACMRDYEIIQGCDRVVVFHMPNSTTQRYVRLQPFFPHIHIVEPT